MDTKHSDTSYNFRSVIFSRPVFRHRFRVSNEYVEDTDSSNAARNVELAYMYGYSVANLM